MRNDKSEILIRFVDFVVLIFSNLIFIQQVHLPLYFRIPVQQPEDVQEVVEEVDEDSYIKVRMRVCSEPGGEVIVNDYITETILDGFRNLGGSRMCNKWVEKVEKVVTASDKQREDLSFEKFISESNQVKDGFSLRFFFIYN